LVITATAELLEVLVTVVDVFKNFNLNFLTSLVQQKAEAWWKCLRCIDTDRARHMG